MSEKKNGIKLEIQDNFSFKKVLYDIYNNYREEIKSINNQLKNSSGEFSRMVQRFNLFPVLDAEKIQKIAESLNLSKRELKCFATIIKKTGWPPHNKLFIKDIKNIVEYFKKNGIEKTNQRLNSYFVKRFNSEEIETMLRTWENRKWLKKRIPILQEAIKAHNNSSYYASVSTILPQIEGMIADGFAYNGKINGKKLKQFIGNLVKDKGDCIDDAVYDFYSTIILVTFDHGKKINSFLSRHAILHGGDTNFGTVENSLKCILLFDYLQDKFKFVTVGNGKCYHLPGCPIVLKHRKAEQYLYDFEFEAKIEGKLPCKICMPDKR
jgi:hypothetical protein